jgi:hypothetical protein
MDMAVDRLHGPDLDPNVTLGPSARTYGVSSRSDLAGQPTRFATELRHVDLVHVVLPRHAYLARFSPGGGPPVVGAANSAP